MLWEERDYSTFVWNSWIESRARANTPRRSLAQSGQFLSAQVGHSTRKMSELPDVEYISRYFFAHYFQSFKATRQIRPRWRPTPSPPKSTLQLLRTRRIKYPHFSLLAHFRSKLWALRRRSTMPTQLLPRLASLRMRTSLTTSPLPPLALRLLFSPSQAAAPSDI